MNARNNPVNLYFQRVNVNPKIKPFNFLFNRYFLWGILLVLSNSTCGQEVTMDIKQLNDKAWEYLYSDTDSAKYWASEAKRKAKDNYSRGAATTRLAIAYDVNGNYEMALKYYYESLGYLKKYGATKELAFLYNNISLCYYNFYDYKKALDYARLSYSNNKSLNDSSGMASCLTNMGLFFGYLDMRDSAHIIFDRSIALSKTIKDTVNLHSSLSNKAKLIFEDGDYQEAQRIYDELKPIITSIPAQISWEISMSQVQLKLNKPDNALTHASKALQLARTNKIRERTLYALENYASVLADVGKTKEAVSFFKDYIALKDSVFSEEMDDRVANEEARYQLLEKENEATAAKNLALEEQLQKETFYEYLIISSVLLIVAIAFTLFLIYYLRIQRKANVLAKEKLEQKELFMHEIHHRVKNNLQMVSAMIDIQSRDNTDHSTRQLFDQMKERLNTMANTHRFLYENHRFQGVTLPQYFEEFKTLFANSLADKHVTLHIETGNDQLHVDTLIPLSLILSEWITNSLKYAFSDRKKGEIAISMERVPEGLRVIYTDNGIGNNHEKEGYGSSMVRSLLRQLKAKMQSSSENGTTYEIIITRIKDIEQD